MAVQEVSSIPFADLVLDARNNNDITTSNTTTAKSRRKSGKIGNINLAGKSQKIYRIMKLKGKSDQSRLKSATTTTLTKENPLVLIQGPPGTGKTTDYFAYIGDFSSATDKSKSRREPGDDFSKRKVQFLRKKSSR